MVFNANLEIETNVQSKLKSVSAMPVDYVVDTCECYAS